MMSDLSMKKMFSILLAAIVLTACNGEHQPVSDERDATEFLSYAGPVSPLSVLGDMDGIVATRTVTFDFSGFGETRTSADGIQIHHNDIRIMDSYILTNNTAEDKTVKLLYPFASSFSELYRRLPVITINGDILPSGLIAGPGWFEGIDTDDGELDRLQLGTWGDYASLLSNPVHLAHAMAAAPDLNQSVVVYEFTNAHTDDTNAIAPTLDASFHLDYAQTTVLTYRFNGGSIDAESGFMRRSFFIPRESESQYLIMIGGDIENLTIQGYANGALNRGEEIVATYDVRRYETVLSDILMQLFTQHIGWYEAHPDYHPYRDFNIELELLYDAVAVLLDHALTFENVANRVFFGPGMLEDIFGEALFRDRIFYTAVEVSIPAGEPVIFDAEMIKPGSFDFFSPRRGNEGVSGYDMLTQQGSNLFFNEITAEIIGIGYIDIVRQNLGFDPGNDVLRVNLDLDKPHYFIEIRNANRSN